MSEEMKKRTSEEIANELFDALEEVYPGIKKELNEETEQVDSIWEIDTFKEIKQFSSKVRRRTDLMYFQEGEEKEYLDKLKQNKKILEHFLDKEVIADLGINKMDERQIRGFIAEIDLIDIPKIKSNLEERDWWLTKGKTKTSDYLESSDRVIKMYQKEGNTHIVASEKYFKEAEFIIHRTVDLIKKQKFSFEQNQQLLTRFDDLYQYFEYQKEIGMEIKHELITNGYAMLENITYEGTRTLSLLVEVVKNKEELEKFEKDDKEGKEVEK